MAEARGGRHCRRADQVLRAGRPRRGVEHERTSRAYFRAERDTPEREEALRAYLESLTAIIGVQQVAVLIVESQRQDRERGDDLARTLWAYTEDGGLLSELMWDYLSDRGVDPQAVWDAESTDSTNGAS